MLRRRGVVAAVLRRRGVVGCRGVHWLWDGLLCEHRRHGRVAMAIRVCYAGMS